MEEKNIFKIWAKDKEDIEVEEERKEIYFVTSLYLNAWLLSKKFQIVKTAKLRNGKVALFYKNNEELHEAMKQYRENDELRDFITQYINVTNMIKVYRQQEEVKRMTKLPWD